MAATHTPNIARYIEFMKKGYPTHHVQDLQCIRDLVYVNANKYGDKPLYVHLENGQKITFTYNDNKRCFDALGTAFAELGLMKSTVAVVGDQHPDWMTAYLTTITSGGVIVPLDKELSCDQMVNFIKQTKCKAVFIAEKIFLHIEEYLPELDCVEYFIIIGPAPDRQKIAIDKRVMVFDDVIALGTRALSKGAKEFLSYRRNPARLCAILFTSGTTGTSKGVMLTEENLIGAIMSCCKMMDIGENDTFVSVLPIHHTFAMTCNHLAMCNVGGTTFMNDSVKHALRNFADFKPTTLIVVPLYVETICKKIWDGIRKKGKEKQVRALIKVSNGLRKVGIDRRREFFAEILNSLGGNIKQIVCGGAPLDPQYIKDFDNFGITIAEGYGITECAPLISVNPFNWRKLGSVGLPAIGMEVKIDAPNKSDDGEILARGKNVFIGYYENEEATAEVFTEDGWFRTGDIGHMDEDNFIYITGRKKNVIIASNGKNVYPEELEEHLLKNEKISETVVIGRQTDGNIVITAVIYPNFDIYAGRNTEDILDDLKKDINNLNKTLPVYKQIRDVELRGTEFEKTTTKKIKRFLVK